MAIRVEHVGDVAVVILKGNFFGEKETNELRVTLDGLTTNADQRKILLNLTGVRRMNSIALGVLFAIASRTSKEHVIACGVQQQVSDILLMPKCIFPFRIYDSCDEALKVLQQI